MRKIVADLDKLPELNMLQNGNTRKQVMNEAWDTEVKWRERIDRKWKFHEAWDQLMSVQEKIEQLTPGWEDGEALLGNNFGS